MDVIPTLPTPSRKSRAERDANGVSPAQAQYDAERNR